MATKIDSTTLIMYAESILQQYFVETSFHAKRFTLKFTLFLRRHLLRSTRTSNKFVKRRGTPNIHPKCTRQLACRDVESNMTRTGWIWVSRWRMVLRDITDYRVCGYGFLPRSVPKWVNPYRLTRLGTEGGIFLARSLSYLSIFTIFYCRYICVFQLGIIANRCITWTTNSMRCSLWYGNHLSCIL